MPIKLSCAAGSKSLNTLERLMLIARVEDKYVFLTNEEKRDRKRDP